MRLQDTAMSYKQRTHIHSSSFPGHLHQFHAGSPPDDAVIYEQYILAEKLGPEGIGRAHTLEQQNPRSRA